MVSVASGTCLARGRKHRRSRAAYSRGWLSPNVVGSRHPGFYRWFVNGRVSPQMWWDCNTRGSAGGLSMGESHDT
ncbi:hypothetical protein FRX31_005897 [Thalictrum thalictroides]|uniref:Uncharacterized protein n=1 Tax=Thalictrum thalictroides TaxID=46969 RepID=A0A7J6X417_THATH|nr:hypothetical protein FRX31_005897 [Thalictrum thalictroides]